LPVSSTLAVSSGSREQDPRSHRKLGARLSRRSCLAGEQNAPRVGARRCARKAWRCFSAWRGKSVRCRHRALAARPPPCCARAVASAVRSVSAAGGSGKPGFNPNVSRQLRAAVNRTFALVVGALHVPRRGRAVAASSAHRAAVQRVACVRPGASAVFRAARPRSASSARSLNALRCAVLVLPRLRSVVQSRRAVPSNPGSANLSVERTNNGGRRCAVRRAVGAPLFAAHLQR
jgi:hypothetical protein